MREREYINRNACLFNNLRERRTRSSHEARGDGNDNSNDNYNDNKCKW